jgi:hypothetical protein
MMVGHGPPATLGRLADLYAAANARGVRRGLAGQMANFVELT